jgi:hypothetical protein
MKNIFCHREHRDHRERCALALSVGSANMVVNELSGYGANKEKDAQAISVNSVFSVAIGFGFEEY